MKVKTDLDRKILLLFYLSNNRYEIALDVAISLQRPNKEIIPILEGLKEDWDETLTIDELDTILDSYIKIINNL